MIININIKKELKLFKDFLVRFNVVGLAIGTIIGFTSTDTMRVISSELIMPIIQLIFNIDNFKIYSIYIHSTKLNIGLPITEIIRLLLTLFLVFCIYTFINTYMTDVVEPNFLEENNKEMSTEIEKTKKGNDIQIQILDELKKLNKKNI